MPYDSNKGYYYAAEFPADTRPDDWPADEPEPEPEEELAYPEEPPVDLGHYDCEICEQAREDPGPLDNLDSLERSIAESRGLPTLSEERERLQAEEAEGEPLVWVSLKAQLEADLAIAKKIKGLELQIEVLTQALEEVKKVAAMKESYLFRHIATAVNLGLNEAERIRGRK